MANKRVCQTKTGERDWRNSTRAASSSSPPPLSKSPFCASPSHRPAPLSLALYPPVIQHSSLSPTSRQTGHKTVCTIDGAGDMTLHPVWFTQHPPHRDKTSRLPIEPFCLRFTSVWYLKAAFLLIHIKKQVHNRYRLYRARLP